MNRLYGLLIKPVFADTSSLGYYGKKFFPVRHTPRTEKMALEIMKDVPEDRAAMFVCFLCTAVMDTIFGREITDLDKENTYGAFVRDPSKQGDDSSILVWDLTRPSEELKPVYKWLDEDIKDRLVLPGWLDIMAALCLQILRETV